ncbi:MAG: hypothetical protein ACI9GW_000281 [Halieaceae bacterium]|jgi:hypothetical protein
MEITVSSIKISQRHLLNRKAPSSFLDYLGAMSPAEVPERNTKAGAQK